jgi:hypothetical protein
MTLFYVIAILVGVMLIRTCYVFVRFRRLAAHQRRQVSYHLSEGLALGDAIASVLSDLNRQRDLGLTNATINAVSQRLAHLSSVMDASNIVDIFAQFTQRYILLETRIRLFRATSVVVDNSKVLYAAEHLDLQERNGYFLIRPSTEADFTTKYPDAH